MTTNSEQAPAGLADRWRAVAERRLAAFEQAAPPADAAAMEREGKAALVWLRVAQAAENMRQTEQAAAEKGREAKARRDARMDEAIMDEFTPEELEERAAELRDRVARMLAHREGKSAVGERKLVELGRTAGAGDLRLGADDQQGTA